MRSSVASLSLALFLGAGACVWAQGEPSPSGQAAGHGAFRQACGADLQSLCAGAQTREDRRACMMANKDKLSDGCKSFLASHIGHRQGGEHGTGQ